MTPYYSKNGITIYCGDCLEILPFLSDIDSLVSDPPYGVDFNTDYTRFTNSLNPRKQNKHLKIRGDKEPFSPIHLLGYRRVALFGANCYPQHLTMGTFLVWDKRILKAKKNLLSDAEIIWMNHGHGIYIFHHMWSGFARASEIGTSFHPSQKPVAVLQWILQHTKPHGLICDPYMGSGSTLLAAQNMGLQATGIEIDEEYCKITADRLRQPSLFAPSRPHNNKIVAELLPSEQLELIAPEDDNNNQSPKAGP